MATCGTGNWTGPKPGDPDNNIVLSAVASYGAIKLSWTWPATNPSAVAHVQIYRAESADINYAMLIAYSNTDRYIDTDISEGITYYYWIKMVSINGTTLAAVGPASAAPLPEIEKYLAILTGQIDAGLLAQTLRNEVDAIPLNRAAFDAEVAARILAGDALAVSISGAQGAADNAIALVAQEVVARTSVTDALAQQINSVGVALGEDVATVEQNATASINSLTGEVHALWTVRVGANGLVGGFGIWNDAQYVQAGFDVDTFWVGRTGPDKIKPFMISGGVVYINNAVIKDLNASNITVSYLSALQANLGDITAGNITLGQGYAGSWSYMRTRAAKWWSDGVTGLIAAGYGPTNSFFFDVTAGPSYIRMSDGASVGTSAEISLGYGKFVANSSGAVIADTVDIRRRVVLETGQADPPTILKSVRDQLMVMGESGWTETYPTRGAGETWTDEIEMVVLTNRYDSTAWDIYGSNQPYYVTATPNGAFRQWSGNASDYYVVITARAVPVRSYSNVGQYANDYRVAIVFHYYVKLIAGSFSQFQLPLIDWTLYKL